MNLLVLLAAIAIVENSTGNPTAVSSAGALGPLQIKPCVVDDLNNRGYRFSYEDRKDKKKSIRMAIIYLNYYNNHHYRKTGTWLTDKQLAGVWNQGYVGMQKYPAKVNEYWDKVQIQLALQAKGKT